MDRDVTGDGWIFFRDDREVPDTPAMRSPVRCRHCGHVYDLGTVEVLQRYQDCSMWRCPGCKVLVDDRKPPWGIRHYDNLPRTENPHD